MAENKNAKSDGPLGDSMYTTYCARFNADERLRYLHKLSNFSTMILAVDIIAFTLLSNQYGLDNNYLISIILSVFLLGITAIEYGNNRIEQAINLHKNAIEISALYYEYMLEKKGNGKEDINKKRIIATDKKFLKKYNEVIKSCPFNHSPIDLYQAKKNNDHIDGKKIIYKCYYWFHHIRQRILYYLVIASPLMLAYFYICH